MPMILEPLSQYSVGQIIVLISASVVAGLARGFSGFGGALIFMPLASAAIGPKLASPLILLIDAITSPGLVPQAWRQANRREVFTMVAGALVGVPAGTAILAFVPTLTLRWAISVVVLALLLFLLTGWRYRGKPKAPLTVLVGVISGLFGGAAQISGPPVVAYWLGGTASGPSMRSNVILFFAISSLISAASYVVGGFFTIDLLSLTMIAAPGYGLGLFIGTRMFRLASDAVFRRICFGLIAIAAIAGLPLLDAVRP